MKPRCLPRALLALTFLLGQLFALAHATRHDIVAHGEQHCEICTLAHASPVPPAPVLPPPQAVPHHAPQAAQLVFTTDRRPFDRPNTRGPPHILA